MNFEDKVIISICFILFLIVILVFKFYSSFFKGSIGEEKVARLLKKLNKEEYTVLNDIYLEINGRRAQIDHLILSKYGIFVIETKNYKGWILGGEKNEYWTQSIYKKKIYFRNPLKQNLSHIIALKAILKDYDVIKYHPIVVFVGDATLKNVYSSLPVIYKSQLLELIKAEKNLNLSFNSIAAILNKIQEFQTYKNKKRKHKKYIKQYIIEKDKKVKSMVCPNCNGNLIAKNGRFGIFYGCSNFPKCRYSKKI